MFVESCCKTASKMGRTARGRHIGAPSMTLAARIPRDTQDSQKVVAHSTRDHQVVRREPQLQRQTRWFAPQTKKAGVSIAPCVWRHNVDARDMRDLM